MQIAFINLLLITRQPDLLMKSGANATEGGILGGGLRLVRIFGWLSKAGVELIDANGGGPGVRPMSYRRSQLQKAIARIWEPDSEAPSVKLRTRIKRLLELDRKLGRDLRSQDVEERNFAFFSAESPGRGADVSFSEYEAFAVLTGLRIMEHGWPQSLAVSVMRRVRPELAREHQRILSQNPDQLFQREVIRQSARAGDLAVDNTDPVFLTVISGARAPDKEGTMPVCAVCRGLKAVNQFRHQIGASSFTVWEMATIAQRLSEQLRKTESRRRGRATGRNRNDHD